MQETQVQSQIWDDPVYLGATKPVHHNYGACALESGNLNYRATCHIYWSPSVWEPVLSNKSSPRGEKPAHCNKSLLTATRENPLAAMKTQCFLKFILAGK